MQQGSDLFHFLTTLHVSGASCTHHQECDNCIYSPWYELHIGQPPSYVAGSETPCYTPDDGCKKRPKHVE